jgi:hypothetical protein
MQRIVACIFSFFMLGLAGYLYYATPRHPEVDLTEILLTVAQRIQGLETGNGPNLAWPNRDFSGSRWRPERLAVAPNSALAPDGTNSAVKLIETVENVCTGSRRPLRA